MARYIALGVWFITGIAVLFFLFANAQELDSSAQDQFDSAEENRQSGSGLQQSANNNRRRAGGTIKYKKISVMKSGSAFEKPGLFEVPDLGQNKTRRLKSKTSNRHTMIYRPTKKSFPSSKKESLGLSTATTPSPEVKVQRLPDSSRNYGTKSWQQVQPVTEVINSFIRPTKRNRVRVNNRPSNDITASTTPAAKVTLDPMRPISRIRSGSITTTTTSAPTTTKFLRLSRKPSRWQSNVSNNKKHPQPAKQHGTDNSELPSSVIPTPTSESTTVVGISSSPKTDVIQLTEATVISGASKDEAPESADIEHVKEESAIRKIAAKPDKIAYFEMSESISRPKSGHKDSSQEQQRTVRPRLHVPKKDSAHYESQRETSKEPILLQTKEQREQQQQQQQQQQLEKNEDALHQPEVSVQFPRVRQRLPQPESNSPQPLATVEETEKRLEKYEAEKNKQLDRLRQSKIPDAIIQFGAEESPRARIVPSRTEYQNGPVRINSAPLNEKEESVLDFTRVPPSEFGQRLPPGQNSLPQSDSRPAYYEFEASYPAPGKVEQQRYIYNPSAGTKPNSNQERYRPETEYNTTPRPNHDSNRRPEVIYIRTTPRPDEEKYLRPEVIYTSRPNANEDRRPEVIYTTLRPMIPNEDRRPDVIYQTTPRPIVSDEKQRRPEIIYTPPEHEYQPPSAYLAGQGTYPRVRIAYQPAPSTIPPPPVTYEPPHLEFMPPSASPPPRIYVPPVEEYKPPATTAVVFQGQRPEEKTPSVVHSQRFEDSRVNEGLRKLEAINSYTRLVSVGHPSIKQLPYPPERDGPTSGSSRPVQQPEPIVITVTENPYRSYERAQAGNEKGERFQEKPYVLHGNYQRDPAAGKSHLVESAYIIGSATPVVHQERPRPTFEGSSLIVGKPYPIKDEAPVQIHVAAYASYERPKSESLILERPVYSSPSGEINTGRRFPDLPSTSERPSYQQAHQLNQPSNQPYQSYQPDQPYQSYQPNPSHPSYRADPSHQSYQVDQSHPSYRPDQFHQSYQSNQPSQAYQLQQPSNQYNQQPLQSKEPRKLNFPPSASERPYVIHLPAGRDVIEVTDNRYENVIPVSEQPQHKHYGAPAAEDEFVVRTERPPQEIRYVVTEKPITVTVRPHGVPSPESERTEIAYHSQVTSDQSSLLMSMSETKTNMAKNQQLTIQDQQTRPAADVQSDEQKPQLHQQPEFYQSNIPASFYPVGPVRAYQVTHAVYPSPPPRFFQLPGPLPNPFEDQFPASPPSSTPPPPTPPPSTPPPPTPPPRQQQPNSFENHLPKGDTWAVNPLFQNQDQFPSGRPFTSSIQPLITEESPHSSEKVVRYRPASFYHDNERLNRSLAHHTVPPYQQQPQLLYDRPIVIQETYRVKAEGLTYHQPPGNYNEPTVISKQIFNRPPENPSHLQPTPDYYNNQPQDSYDHQQQSEQDFSGVEGTPGVDYPILHSVPHDLKFKCELVDSPGTRHPAYYADPYTRCQVFHVCQSNRAKNSFLCPNGTIFNQKVRVCDWWHNVQCDESSAYYNVNTDDENNYQFKLSSH